MTSSGRLSQARAPEVSDPSPTDQGRGAPHPGMVWIPGGTFRMGSDDHYPEEAPTHKVTVDGFWMDQHAVTNAEFSRFVKKTRHVTSAERAPDPADYPGAEPELLVAASVVFRQPTHRGVAGQPLQLVDLRARSQLAPAAGPGQLGEAAAGPSRGPRRLGGRGGVRRVGRQGAADRGRVGVRRPRRPGRRHLRLGRRAHARRPLDGEHLAGRVPPPQHRRGRPRGHRTRRLVPAQRLRPARHDRQRLGVDQRLVRRSRAGRPRLLQHREPSWRRARGQPRPGRPGRPDPAQGDEGRLPPVRTELLPALPAGGPDGAAHRHLDVPPRLPLHQPTASPDRAKDAA